MKSARTFPLSLCVGDIYPLSFLAKKGAAAQFLVKDTNILQIFIPNMSDMEEKALRMGRMDIGVVVDLPLVMFIFSFQTKHQEAIVMNSPFDARIIPSQLFDISRYNETKNKNMLVDVHIIDSETGVIRGLRSVSIPESISCQFINAVNSQLLIEDSVQPKLAKYMRVNPENLPMCTKMEMCHQ